MLKDEGKGRGEETQEIIRQRETSCDVSQHQDTVEIEMVSLNKSAYKSDTVGTGENWEEKKVCWNPEVQTTES